MDTLTTEQRRRVMAHNRGRTGPERELASALWRMGFRYLTGDGFKARFGKALAGNPDIVFTKKRFVVFMDGCFWHGCKRCRRTAKQNAQFWRDKIRKNIERDRRTTAALKADGWEVIRVPEHDVRTKGGLQKAVHAIQDALTKGE